MKKHYFECIAAAILCAFLFGCSEVAGLKESDVLGKYEITIKAGTETIELKGDRSFVQTYLPYSGKPVVQRGNWKAHFQGTNHFQLDLRDALILDRYDVPVSPKAIDKELLPLWPYRSSGKVYLQNSPDGDKIYKKIQ